MTFDQSGKSEKSEKSEKNSALIQFSTHIFCVKSATNCGAVVWQEEGATKVLLIDSGNHEREAAFIYETLQKKFGRIKVESVINTHSHADHCGGNPFFVNECGSKIIAPVGEASLMNLPALQTSVVWGGSPVHQLKSEYLLAEKSSVDKTIRPGESLTFGETVTLEAIPLPGHYFCQCGYLVRDEEDKKSVFFLADALSGRNVIKRYWIQYLLDEGECKRSIQKASGIKADFYQPSHGDFVTEIEGLAELNLIAMLETEDLILDIIKKPATTEEVLKKVVDRNGIKLKLSNWALILSTVRCYLSNLYEEGKATFEIVENSLYWKKI